MQEARADFAKADADLNRIYRAVLTKLFSTEKQKLKETQRAWVSKRDDEGARAAKEAEGGSMAPTLRYEEITELTQKRIKELELMLDVGRVHPKETAAIRAAPPPAMTSTSVSPDKKWEYKCVEYDAGKCLPQIIKAGTTQRVVNLNDVPDGASGMGAEVLWAPDSNRFAFNYRTPLTHHSYETVAFCQLHGDKLEALVSLADGLASEDYPQQCDPYQGDWQLRNWTNPNTAILYAACPGKVESAFLFTVEFDGAGNWKIVKTHRVSEKEVEKRQAKE